MGPSPTPPSPPPPSSPPPSSPPPSSPSTIITNITFNTTIILFLEKERSCIINVCLPDTALGPQQRKLDSHHCHLCVIIVTTLSINTIATTITITILITTTIN